MTKIPGSGLQLAAFAVHPAPFEVSEHRLWSQRNGAAVRLQRLEGLVGSGAVAGGDSRV